MPAMAAPANSQFDDTDVKLNLCQQQFGESGTASKIIGILPLQGNYFHGTVTIGKATLVDEHSERTPFATSNIQYYLMKEHKYYTLNLTSGSYCEAYENEAGSIQEVIEFNWDQKPPMNNLSAINLKPVLLPRVGCYIGAEPGDDEIVFLCQYPELSENGSDSDYYYQALNQLQVLFSDDQMIEDVCAQIPTTAVKNSRAKCRTGLKTFKTEFKGPPVRNHQVHHFSENRL